MKEPSLFDCLQASNNNLNGYSTEANTDIDMSGAEFLFEAAEGGDDYYTIRSVATGSYLINLPGAQYFGNQKITHQLIRAEAEGGEEAFEIRRKSNDEHNDRYVYYYYPKMGFDAVSIKNDNFVRNGNFAFALLEKQEYPSDLDQISGYRRVSKITSGKTYLITQTYVEPSTKRTVRFVLYPGNSIQNQSKMYQDVETKGVRLTAVGSVGDSTNVTIGERSYKVSITEACSHEGYGRYYKGAKEPSCEEEGYTGDMYCENCDEIVEQGTKIEAGHDIPAASWQVSTSQAPSFTEDGQYVGVCRKCGKTQTKPYTKNEYATQQLNAKLVTARSYREADYTVKSYAPLKDALNKAQNVEDTAEAKKALIDEFDAAIAGLELKSEFNAAKAKLKEKLVKMKEALSKEEAAFAPEVWTALNAASDELKKAEIGIDLSALADAAAIDAKLEELKLSVLNAAWEKVEDVSTNTIEEEKEEQERKDLADQIKNACSDAKAIIDAGQGSYTDESWKAFEDAYKAANLKESVLLSKTKEELQKLFDDLKTAKENLKTKEPEKDEAFEAAKTEVADAVKAADAVAGAGQKNYTKESWDAFMKAYNEAKNPPANADAAMLKKLAAALKAAQAALVTAPENTLVKGQTEDVGGIRYQVLDPVKRTVTAKLGLKKKASSIKIPATVKVKGETCTVVQIANKAFKGYSKAKKLTIGKNVTTIGKQAFLNCKKLKTVTLQSKVLKNIKAKAFKGTAKNPKVKWPKGLKKAKKKTLTRSFKKQGLKIK